MKKYMDKGLIFLGAGLLAMLLELLILHQNLNQLNILTYLLAIGIIPAVILFVSVLLYSANTKAAPVLTYARAIAMALIFSVIMLVYCGNAITPELVETILANSITSDTTQVSMTEASAGDNIQSVLIFVAFSGIGAFIGNRIRKKKAPAPATSIEDEYDS